MLALVGARHIVHVSRIRVKLAQARESQRGFFEYCNEHFGSLKLGDVLINRAKLCLLRIIHRLICWLVGWLVIWANALFVCQLVGRSFAFPCMAVDPILGLLHLVFLGFQTTHN